MHGGPEVQDPGRAFESPLWPVCDLRRDIAKKKMSPTEFALRVLHLWLLMLLQVSNSPLTAAAASS